MAAANIANVQLWAKKDGDVNYTRIDLFPEAPIKLTLSVTDIMDPLATTSIFSRSFRVPNTQANNAFFKAVFNVNSVSFDASKKVAAYINDSGSFYTNGNIRLMSTYTNDKDADVQYEILFMGETSDFGGQIGGGFLSEINLSEYNHDQTYFNIINSWNTNSAGVATGLFNGDVVYPLCNWGYTYKDGFPEQATTAIYNAITGVKGFTASINPLVQSQMKPSIRAKALWDKIFAETEYTYESAFLESEFFSKMYIMSEKQARPALNVDLTFLANNTAAQNFDQTGAGLGQLLAPFETYDPNGVWNPATSVYTAQATSGTNYSFQIAFKDRVQPFSSPLSILRSMTYTVSLRNADTLAILGSHLLTANSLVAVSRTLNFTLPLNAGDRVIFTVEPTPVIPASAVGGIQITNFNAAQLGGPQIVTMGSVMPDNIRKIDFMRSIINRFKLVFVPSPDNEKKFTITPWKDWILQGTSYDWNLLLDASKDIKSTPLFYGQSRFQIYTDQEDADFPNYNYQLSYKQTYGQLNLDSDNELLTGTVTVRDQFAPTPIFPIGGAVPGATGSRGLAAKFLIPWLSKADFTAVQNNPIQPKLRLVFYNGIVAAPVTWYLQDDFGTAQAQTTYPLMSEYSYWPVDTSSFDLSWNNIDPLYDVELAANPPARTNFDTFNVYWSTWYNTNFDPYSRKVEMTLVLDYNQILDLRFNNYYFIKDAWYLVNKVTDYIAGQTTACKVELIKVGNAIGLTIPPTGPQSYAHGLCYVSPTDLIVTFCDAYCCAQSTLTALYYTNNVSLTASTVVWQDVNQTNPANPGYYASSDGTVFEVGVGGFIITFFDGSTCEPCTRPPLTSFPGCCRGTSLCQACCCDGTTVNLWGDGPELYSSSNVYFNAGGTAPATNGWYKDPAFPDYAVQVRGGVTWSIGLCDTCVCGGIEVYEKSAIFTELTGTVCEACTTAITPTTVWLNEASWAIGTTVYITNSADQPATGGYWRNPEDGEVWQTGITGVISANPSCAACSPIYYYTAFNCTVPDLFQNFSSTVPIEPGQVVSSLLFPGQCWTILGPAGDGYPVDIIHDNCESCAETWICNCVEYLVTTDTKGESYLSYKDCTTGELLFQEIQPGNAYNICMCEGSAGTVEGRIYADIIGPCSTPPCYVWDLSLASGAVGEVEYEECVTGLIKTINLDAGGLYQVCAVDGTVTTLSGDVTITQLDLCG